MRTRLHEAGTAEGPRALASNDYTTMRDTAHVSVAVFRAPVVPERSIGGVVSTRREERYGTVRPAVLDLVRYDLAGGEITMNRLAGIDCAR
ncbi:hypothetical protein ACFTXO_26310 [Streptomyces sp. NPDC057067]|uniref:hypothetical protein n=1 Tax=Streptomyces TaxID=1883 RepID=UPI00192202CC|nr:hypothetical protein [Streptomyces silvae]MBL1288509.1 hypothetical protein [Streptomyces silvae]